jgi:hypothetical protein
VTWQALFESASRYDVSEPDVRTTLRAVRETTPEDDDDD